MSEKWVNKIRVIELSHNTPTSAKNHSDQVSDDRRVLRLLAKKDPLADGVVL